MRPTLQEQLQFLTRTVNPDYLIIVQNKANENMDFSQFKINYPEEKEKKIREQRHIIVSIEEWTKTQSKILVKDNHFNARIVLDLLCRKEKLQENLDKVKRKYRGDTLEKI